MRRACRGTAPRTSGQYPEPDPELCSPDDLPRADCRPFGPTTAGLSALGTRVQRARLSERNSRAGEAEWAFTAPLGVWERGAHDAGCWAPRGEDRRTRFGRAAPGRAGSRQQWGDSAGWRAWDRQDAAPARTFRSG